MSQEAFITENGTSTPAPYLVRVQGNLDAGWIEYFGGISIIVLAGSGHLPTSIICTHEADQARLMGLLNSLYDFGFPILSLERLAPA